MGRFRLPCGRIVPNHTGLAVVATALVLLVSCTRSTAPSNPELAALSPGHRELIKALGGRRVVEPRLVGFDEWALCASDTDAEVGVGSKFCQSMPTPGTSRFDMLGEAGESIRRASLDSDSGPSSNHARGVWRLLWSGQHGGIGSALTDFRRATRTDPGLVEAEMDLAAGYILRAAASNEPRDLARSLHQADQVLAQRPRLRQTVFNRALAVEQFHLNETAKRLWSEYLGIETDAGWRQEAQTRLDRLDRANRSTLWEFAKDQLHAALRSGDDLEMERIVSEFPVEASEFAVEVEVAGWSKAVLGNRIEEVRLRDEAIERLARALEEAGAGSFLQGALDEAALLARSREKSSQMRDLARAIEALQAGKEAYSRFDTERAMADLKAAVDDLEQLKSNLSLQARYFLGLSSYQIADYEVAKTMFESLAEDPGSFRWPTLKTKVLTVLGLVAYLAGKYEESFDLYQSALELAREIGDRQGIASSMSGLAEVRLSQGYEVEGWQYIRDSLEVSARLGNDRLRRKVLGVASWACQLSSLDSLARYLNSELIELHATTKDPASLVSSLRHRAELSGQLGLTDSAWEDLERARMAAQEIGDPDVRRIFEGDLLLVEAQLSGALNPASAFAAATKAIGIFEATDYSSQLSSAYLRRGRLLRDSGELEAARSDFDQAFDLLASQRQALELVEDRAVFLHRLRDVTDLMVQLQALSLGNASTALEYAERYRLIAQQLEASESNVVRQTAALERLAERLVSQLEFKDTVVIDYWQLEDRLLLWALTRHGLKMKSVELPRRQLAGMIEDFTNLLFRGQAEDEIVQLQVELYAILVEPIAGLLRSGVELVIVPDGPLWNLPFAALRASPAAPFLIQESSLALSFSADQIVGPRSRHQGDFRSSDSVLLVANPTRGTGESEWPDLPHSDAALAWIADLFINPVTLSGDRATKEAFVSNAGKSRIVHFGGHALVNPRHPLQSAFLLAASEVDRAPDGLKGVELLGLDWSATDLVFLSACRTAAHGQSSAPSLSSLSTLIAAMGVPYIVGTFTDVEDRAAAELSRRFYRHLLRGSNPAAALRNSQVEIIKSKRIGDLEAHRWASFALLTGSSARAPLSEGRSKDE